MQTRLPVAILVTALLLLPSFTALADPLGERIALDLCILGEGDNATIQITGAEAARWRASAIEGHVFKTLFNGYATKSFNGDFTKAAGSDLGKCVRSSLNNFGQESCYGSNVELISGTTTLRRLKVEKILCP
ncbi:MAG: hypothetical protein PHG91_04650 [Syntrophales bacterium]|nr:hypothetical protein [Syntrophales bacterium]MDD5533546.1 hypothetical protein [Syntrophales bacterium]